MSVERLAMIKYKIDDIELFLFRRFEIYQAILKSQNESSKIKFWKIVLAHHLADSGGGPPYDFSKFIFYAFLRFYEN